ncbi:MAG: aldolase [candidate division NC10 bacterium]|nr:aldolase [candidate division NC10 bacterium]
MAQALRNIVRNHFMEKLRAGQVVSKLTIRISRSIEIAHIAKSCGFDALYVDLQHGLLSIETTSQLCIAALGVGITPLVRVPGTEYVTRVLDGGAMGVVVLDVRCVADVENAIAQCKFEPVGKRSIGGGLPQLQYREWPQAEMVEVMNEATAVLVQVENTAALDCVEDIAAVPGVDVLMIGTNDLCASLGVPGQFGHNSVRDAYKRVIAAARKHGVYVGVGGISDRKIVAEYVKLGARLVSMGSDISLLMSSGTDRAQYAKKLNDEMTAQ